MDEFWLEVEETVYRSSLVVVVGSCCRFVFEMAREWWFYSREQWLAGASSRVH
jgi:hypothetical protein